MKSRVTLLAWLLAFGTLMPGQVLPSFEVATIKPWQRDTSSPPAKVMKVAPVGGGGLPTARVHMILPTALLVASAYDVPVGSEKQMIQGPAWIYQDIDQYEIQAKIDDSIFAAMQKMTPVQQRAQVALMERSLLADRFKLKVHFETKEMPVYALTVAKGGLKLTPAKDGEVSAISTLGTGQGREMRAVAVSLSDFARSPLLIGPADGRLVVDQTALTGAWDFILKWDVDQIGAPSFFTAIQEQLGLKLVPSKAPVEVIVIDHIEPPSPN